ncbi:helix-turn-helix domain-containing protein [Jonesia denitrificans]|nr:helix-turn-helix transcriptional regulator [Jonesia denitrificans]QXB42546.1 helix-turn-helix domain-containing protein [Jonesia denitrificans]
MDRKVLIMNEEEFGAHVRRARLIEDLSQQEVADRANITRATLTKLETGHGSSLKTLIKVLRALGRDDWLGTLEPIPDISPLRLAREAAGIAEPRRASRRRPSPPRTNPF